MNTKTKSAAVILLTAFGIWFYYTPYRAVEAMTAAAHERDAVVLSEYVNFPAVKESLKGSINAKIVSEAGKETEKNPMGVLGAALAAAFVSPLVDALVTPEGLARMMEGGKPFDDSGRKPARSTDADTETSMGYESFNRFVATVKQKGTAEDAIGFVFNRDGMFGWKLSALRLPP